MSVTNGVTQCLDPTGYTKSELKHICKSVEVRTGFEIAERSWIGHGYIANIQRTVGQGGLFSQCLTD